MTRDDFWKRFFEACFVVLVSAFVCAVVMMFVGCKTVYTPVDVHDRDSVRIEYRIDSVYVYHYDSVRVQMPCSDSIEYAYVYKWTRDTVYKRVEVRDTVSVCKTDTIYQAVEVEVPVKYVPSYYHWVSWLFWILIVGLLGWSGWKIYKRFFLHV